MNEHLETKTGEVSIVCGYSGNNFKVKNMLVLKDTNIKEAINPWKQFETWSKTEILGLV